MLRAHIKVVGAAADEKAADGSVPPPGKLEADKPLKISGIANANIVDRVNETLDPSGVSLANYLKNPVILADHNYSRPIGAATRVWAEADGLHFEAEIGRPDLAPLTEDQIEKRSLIAQGILCTVSVGFIPLERRPAEYTDEGDLVRPAVFTKWELLEISVVSVPCNADSVFEIKELDMKTKTGEAAAASKDQPPVDGDTPATGTAGEMLKAVLDHCSGMKEMLTKACGSMDDLHKKFDAANKPADDAEEGDTPPDEEAAKAATDAAAATDARLTALENGIKSLSGALEKLAPVLAKMMDKAAA